MSFAEIINASAHFMPHGHCYLWIPSLVWLHVISDSTIALAYMLIPFALGYIVYKRKDLIYGWIFLCFCAFIIACGTTHIMEVWTLWYPDYWLSGFIKAITAIVSLTTAILLLRLIPNILAFPNETTLREAHTALEKSENKFKNILEGAPDAMVIANQDGNIEMINAQAEKFFGYSKKELIGKKIECLVPERFRRIHVSHRDSYFANPHTRPMGADLNLLGLRKDGSEFPVEISLSPVETEEGTIALAAIRDITDKKQIETLLIEKNVQLVNSDMAKDQFLTHMSHELRTPLNGIIAMTQLLLTTDLSKEQKEQLDIISESNEQLLAVINQILDFSKVESGNIGVEYVEFNIRDIINKVVASYALKAAAKKIELTCYIHPDIPVHCHSDIVKIRQILSNILDNAVKFTEQGTVDVTVAAHKPNPNQTNLVITVTDTGIGIPADILPKLFKPFSQGDSSMTRKYGGTGLGLAISKRLAEVMGGSIDVKSHAIGTQFIFTVPCVSSVQFPEEEKSHEIKETRNETMEKHNGRILLVEDNKLNQRTLFLLLNKLGYTVSVANDGLEALQALKTANYHLILMDCQMPNMDGYMATAEIRKNELGTNRHTPIIGVTAHAMDINRQKCLDAGMDDYISKPFNIQELNKLILKHVTYRKKD